MQMRNIRGMPKKIEATEMAKKESNLNSIQCTQIEHSTKYYPFLLASNFQHIFALTMIPSYIPYQLINEPNSSLMLSFGTNCHRSEVCVCVFCFYTISLHQFVKFREKFSEFFRRFGDFLSLFIRIKISRWAANKQILWDFVVSQSDVSRTVEVVQAPPPKEEW